MHHPESFASEYIPQVLILLNAVCVKAALISFAAQGAVFSIPQQIALAGGGLKDGADFCPIYQGYHLSRQFAGRGIEFCIITRRQVFRFGLIRLSFRLPLFIYRPLGSV